MYVSIASALSPARLRRGMRLFLSAFALSLLGGGGVFSLKRNLTKAQPLAMAR